MIPLRGARATSDVNICGEEEGRYGDSSGSETDDRVGSLASGSFDVTADVLGIAEDSCDIGRQVLGARTLPLSVVALGAFAPLCSIIAGIQPFGDGVQLIKNSRGSAACLEDKWGEATGVSKVVTGFSLILGSVLKVISRTLTLMVGMLRTLPAEIAVAAGTLGLMGTGLYLVLFLSVIGRSCMSIFEGRCVVREIEALVRETVSGLLKEGSKGELTCALDGMGVSEMLSFTRRHVDSSEPARECLKALRERLERDPLFQKKLKRVTKGNILDEVMHGAKGEIRESVFVLKKGAINPVRDAEGAAREVFGHIEAKQLKRVKVNLMMIGLCVLTIALAVVSVCVTGGTPLIVVTVLSVLLTVVWLAVDLHSFLKAIRKGDVGTWDRAVLLVTTAMILGLVVVATVVSSGGVMLLVMAGLASLCVGIQLVALYAAHERTGCSTQRAFYRRSDLAFNAIK